MSHPPSVTGSPRSRRSMRSVRSAGTVAEEHRLLRALIAEIEAALKGKPLRHSSGLDVVAVRLDTLRGPLGAHFDEEERAGLFERIEEAAPEHAAACARLREDHGRLLIRLDALRRVTPEGRRGAEWARGVRALIEELSDHETRETDLLVRSLDGGSGAPD
jgi:Hemerythrin HHE cation binding domain